MQKTSVFGTSRARNPLFYCVSCRPTPKKVRAGAVPFCKNWFLVLFHFGFGGDFRAYSEVYLAAQKGCVFCTQGAGDRISGLLRYGCFRKSLPVVVGSWTALKSLSLSFLQGSLPESIGAWTLLKVRYATLWRPWKWDRPKLLVLRLQYSWDPVGHSQECRGTQGRKCPKKCFGSAFGNLARSVQKVLRGVRFKCSELFEALLAGGLGTPVHGRQDRIWECKCLSIRFGCFEMIPTQVSGIRRFHPHTQHLVIFRPILCEGSESLPSKPV